MAELIASGNAIAAILLLMIAELIALIIVRKKTGQGIPTLSLLASLAAGAALLLSLRASLLGLAWKHIAAWLIVALIAHLLDLKLRWQIR